VLILRNLELFYTTTILRLLLDGTLVKNTNTVVFEANI